MGSSRWMFYQITMIIILLLITLSSVSPQFTVSSKSHLSRASSWRCGFFLVDARPRNGRQPAATFFIVQKHFPAQCPTKTFLKNARGWKKECNTQGEDWARKWDPEKGSGRGKNGDKVCKIAQKEMGEYVFWTTASKLALIDCSRENRSGKEETSMN